MAEREETVIDLTVPPDLARRCEIHLEERFPWFGIEPKPPPGSPHEQQLRVAIVEWWRQLPGAEHERVFVHIVEQCLEDLVEKDGLLLEDATPEQLSKAAMDEFARCVRALGR
jgi:hypothetical protein